MQTPPLLLGVAILFWGWHSGLIMAALPLALVAEGSRWIRLRWEFSALDYQRIWNGCLLLLLASVVFAVGYSRSLLDSANTSDDGGRDAREAASQAARWALLFFQWQPLVFAPFAVAVLLGGQPLLPVRVFSWLARRRKDEAEDPPGFGRTVAAIPGYVALVLFAACTTNHRSLGVFVAILGFIGWGLWACRSRRTPLWLWLALLLVCGLLGFGVQTGLSQLQRFVANLDSILTQKLSGSQVNPSESRTTIGSIGRLKGSGTIVLKVTSTNEISGALVRQASYDSFLVSTWRTERSHSNSLWRPIVDEQRPGSWSLVHHVLRPEDRRLRLMQFTKGRNMLLALPNGSVALEDLPVDYLSKNGMGCVRAADPPELLDFGVLYTMGSTLDDRPTDRDLMIPKGERETIESIARRLRLSEVAREEQKMVFAVLLDYFSRNFEYSTYLEGAVDPQRSHLADFLLNRRKGHCEYFATATCLLLRAAGVPARYAVGYAVSEKEGESHYVVRDRHAHAWCLVWSPADRRWVDFDTTPPSWGGHELARSSKWETLGDLGFRFKMEYAQWRAGKSELSRYSIYVLSVVLVGFFLKMFLSARRQSKSLAEGTGSSGFGRPGLDSEFYLVERYLARQGAGRRSDETLLGWLARLRRESTQDTRALANLVDLHYRLRFDPLGLDASNRARLKQEADLLLATLREGGKR